MLGHSNLSRTHLHLYGDTIKDVSTHGTFIHIKNLSETLRSVPSGFVPFDKNQHITVLGYHLEVKEEEEKECEEAKKPPEKG